MKKMQKFLKRKFYDLGFNLVVILLTIIALGIISLPGALIAFLFETDASGIVFGGVISIAVCGLIIAITSGIKNLIKEYKNFDE